MQALFKNEIGVLMSIEWIKKHLVEIIAILVAIGIAVLIVFLLGPTFDQPKEIGNFASLCLKWRSEEGCSEKAYPNIGEIVKAADPIAGTREIGELEMVCEKMFPGIDSREAMYSCQDICMNFCNPLVRGG